MQFSGGFIRCQCQKKRERERMERRQDTTTRVTNLGPVIGWSEVCLQELEHSNQIPYPRSHWQMIIIVVIL